MSRPTSKRKTKTETTHQAFEHAPNGISDAELKRARQSLIQQVKDAKVELIKTVMEHKLPFHLIAPHDDKFATGVIGLWHLGYFPSQISRMTSTDESSVLGSIRLHYAEFQTQCIRDILSSK
jgi:hypothetical protein